MRNARIIVLCTPIAAFVLAGLGLAARRGSSTVAQTISATVTADQLAGAYNANEVAADQQYKGNTISVSGAAGDIGTQLMGHAYVMPNPSDPMLPQVQCVFADDQKAAVAGITKGAAVTVVGKVEGTLGFIEMSGCTLQ